ncbi:MAG: DNA double-strand break repair nuclease NurA [Verrucomicrobiae bacterium]|nr:DNA double-strand break repair nuclease NurA [Verrucomicrobiae bacterium]
MRTSCERLEKLERSLRLALDHEWPRLATTQGRLKSLAPRPIPPLPPAASRMPSVATVATDGGENRLNLDPIELHVLRVADSFGQVYFEDFIAQSLTPEEILRFFFQSHPRLQRFIAYLRIDWNDLFPQSDFQRGHMLSMLRELMEWAALLKLATSSPPKLLIRDGLLRSVLLPERVFDALRDRFEMLTVQHGHLLVGVAKRSRVINYLSAALALSETFGSDRPAFVEIPAALEREAAPAQYRWVNGRAIGRLHIARLDRGTGVPLMPVDIAAWQTGRIEEAMAVLHESARASFPIRGYPQALVEAHAHAHLGGLEVELLEQMLMEQLATRDPAAVQVAHELRLLGRRLARENPHDEQEDG